MAPDRQAGSASSQADRPGETGAIREVINLGLKLLDRGARGEGGPRREPSLAEV
ncbi:hypothetical protein [Aquisphaera insulae]|uniref:hypothetical protein n=1 Tax=Aquisphaera insulae TaxID=2712864 RepID=UPI0013EB2AC6|nr:hypothetical protein [Aquisphaera insulae]